MAKNDATESDRETMASVLEECEEIERRIAPYVKCPVSTGNTTNEMAVGKGFQSSISRDDGANPQ